MIITPQNITTAHIDWAKMPHRVKEEKENIPVYVRHYTKNKDISDTLDDIIAEINKANAVKAPAKKAPKNAKGKVPAKPQKKAPQPKAEKKVRTPRKAKKTATKKATPKKKPAAKMKKPAPKKDTAPKAVVKVKKFSYELQLIKSFAAMAGKNRKVATVKSFLSKIQAAKRDTNVPSQKSILTLVARRMKEGLEKLDKGVDTLQNIQIEAGLLKRCKDAVKNAKPRMQVTYLSGLNGKK